MGGFDHTCSGLKRTEPLGGGELFVPSTEGLKYALLPDYRDTRQELSFKGNFVKFSRLDDLHCGLYVVYCECCVVFKAQRRQFMSGCVVYSISHCWFCVIHSLTHSLAHSRHSLTHLYAYC